MDIRVQRYWKYLAVMALALTLDLITKHWIASSMHLGQSIPVIDNFFHLTLVHNRGAAFGIGASWSKWVFFFTSAVAFAVLIRVFLRALTRDSWVTWSCVLILAGAMGNIIDRVRLGYVVDFLDVFVGRYHWPAFNVADSLITIGAVVFALRLWRSNTDVF